MDISNQHLKRMCPQCILALVFEEDLIFLCLLALQKRLFFIFQILCLWKQGVLEIPLKIEQEVHISGLTPGAVQVSGTTWSPHTQCS